MIAALGTVAAVLFIVLCLGVSVVLTRRRAREAETRLAALRSAGLEVSLGYTCVLEIAEGEVDGEPYDAVRRSIRVDHTWVEGGDILDGELRGALPRPSELEGHGPDGGHE